ncbi:hypothetical protein Q8A73_006443 [Channa argus]|nr:hypothetical protein Q8A73_006443 [Channa argus]
MEEISYQLNNEEEEKQRLIKKVEDVETIVRNQAHKIKELKIQPVAANPTALAKRLLFMKEHYIDADEKLQFNEKANAYIECSLDHLRNFQGAFEKPKQLDKATECVDLTRPFLIRLVNEKILEVHKLKKELNRTNPLSKTATKSAPQRLRLCINTMCHSARVSPELTEEPPALYPEDWEPPDLDDMIYCRPHSHIIV